MNFKRYNVLHVVDADVSARLMCIRHFASNMTLLTMSSRRRHRKQTATHFRLLGNLRIMLALSAIGSAINDLLSSRTRCPSEMDVCRKFPARAVR